tara:strand:+ start:1372 stop:2235 length:864 start_codon:yes stop_codon:yes gene_type:complete
MPELPEVEVIKQSLKKYVVNKKILKIIVKNKNLRYPVPENISKKLTNIKIQTVKRISKYLILEFKNELYLLVHLGMSGTLHLITCKNKYKNTNLSFYRSKNLPKKHNHIFLNFKNFSIIYNDPRRFGFIKLIIGRLKLKNYFRKIGPDPFKKNFNFNYVKKYLSKKNKNIKNILMDQQFVAGIGNIYANEILNYSKINPLKKSAKINNKQIIKIIYFTKKILNRSINMGGTTINNFLSIKGDQGSYQKEFRAYNQESENCKNYLCQGRIFKINQSNRSTYMCNKCQK